MLGLGYYIFETPRDDWSCVYQQVQRSKWNGHEVAIVSLREDRVKYKMFVMRVESGVRNMLMVQPSPYATQVSNSYWTNIFLL